MSTIEAEYIACTAAACQVVWHRRVLHDIWEENDKPTKLGCDNMSVIDVARNPTHHDRTKRIHVCFHLIRSLVGDRLISLHHCQTDDQLADIFTKPLGSNIHGKFREQLGLRMLHSRRGINVN